MWLFYGICAFTLMIKVFFARKGVTLNCVLTNHTPTRLCLEDIAVLLRIQKECIRLLQHNTTWQLPITWSEGDDDSPKTVKVISKNFETNQSAYAALRSNSKVQQHQLVGYCIVLNLKPIYISSNDFIGTCGRISSCSVLYYGNTRQCDTIFQRW